MPEMKKVPAIRVRVPMVAGLGFCSLASLKGIFVGGRGARQADKGQAGRDGGGGQWLGGTGGGGAVAELVGALP